MKHKSLLPSQGFTLIELVLVVVLLGILAATAMPRFVNLGGDARKAAIKNIAGSIHSVDTIVFAKSVILGIQNNNRNPTTTDQNPQGGFMLNGNFIWTLYGHPWLFDGSTLVNLLSIDIQYEGINNRNRVCNYSGEFCAMVFSGLSAPSAIGVPFQPGGGMAVYFSGDSVAENCFAYHIFDRIDKNVKIGSVDTGC